MVPDEVVIELTNRVAQLFPPQVPYVLLIARSNDKVSLSGNISQAIPLQGVLAMGQVAHQRYMDKLANEAEAAAGTPSPSSGLVAASASDLSAIDKTIPAPKKSR